MFDLVNEYVLRFCVFFFFFCQAEDGIRDLVRSRGLGDVYKRQPIFHAQLKQECLAASQILIWQEEEKLLVGALENMLSLIHI